MVELSRAGEYQAARKDAERREIAELRAAVALFEATVARLCAEVDELTARGRILEVQGMALKEWAKITGVGP